MKFHSNNFATLATIAFTISALIFNNSPLVFADTDKLHVVTTNTLFADLVHQIGKDRVEVKSISSPRFNTHFYAPTPKDIRNVRKADLYVYAGLDIEAWSDPLLEAAGKSKLFRGGSGNVDLSKGVQLLKIPDGAVTRSEGDIHLYGNPHYHMDPQSYRIMAQTLAEKLKSVDSGNANFYDKSLSEFLEEISHKITEWKDECSHCRDHELIAYHEDTEYFARFLEMNLKEFVEPKPGIPPTPQHLRFLQKYAQDNNIQVITISTFYPRNTAEALAQKIDAHVVTIAQNAGEVPGTSTIFDFFDYNVKQISGAINK